MTKITYLAFLAVVILALSCSRDVTEPPDNSCGSDLDYVEDIKPILDASCALSGCHDGVSASAPGNYSSYNGIKNVLNNGQFSSRVIDFKDNPVLGMPPDDAVMFGGQADLQEEELEMIMQWLDAGFPMESEKVVASYDENIQFIIDTNCSYSGCHNGTPGTPGVYTSFEGLQADIENGAFFERVVERRDDPDIGMPPNSATGPTDLTEEEFQLILCWIENGYPEN